MFSGVDLMYTGGKYNEFLSNDSQSNTERFRHAYKNVGAFTMRIQLGQTQRAALLQNNIRHYCFS